MVFHFSPLPSELKTFFFPSEVLVLYQWVHMLKETLCAPASWCHQDLPAGRSSNHRNEILTENKILHAEWLETYSAGLGGGNPEIQSGIPETIPRLLSHLKMPLDSGRPNSIRWLRCKVL